ncbi:uncharacterized protein LOC21410620 [Morus notabilis]|uniref:uncharacterized protein LOC21410620 n=1 Tax=Morus notabilis TaxID=981085 RepID=UPI000CECF14B|nr:uncharacterized protein LOC21410620 [Morus notabilis]
MNIAAMKTALMSSKPNCIYTRASLFHATPFLERRRRHHWEFRNHNYSKRYRRFRAKQDFLRNASAYADFVFQNPRREYEDDEDDPSSSRGPSWFRNRFSTNDFRRARTCNRGPRGWGRRGFRFCDDDDNDTSAEAFFRSIFGGNRFYYWSFVDGENPQWSNSSTYSGRSWNWRHRFEEECEYESECSQPDLASDRLALGLSAYGPLKLEDVKNAYRTCALNWHPDRHQGSSKVVAEEKFKLCSAAYQSLCDKLGVN